MVYLLSTRPRLRIAVARKKYWSSLTRLQQGCTAPLLDAARPLGSTLPLTTTMALLKPPTPGECFCGKTPISLIDADAIVSSSICHCSVRRRLCGAPFCANLLTPRSNVRIDMPWILLTGPTRLGLANQQERRALPVHVVLEPHAGDAQAW